ncbi:barstar family protein [Serratia marcescens]|uniref:barstar family protein n=2 Tax=Serratia TaxID=613 RepID=UPI0004E75C37|nr:barstar family protein [Serratia marcescens]AVU30528.1 barnase inhibitor [Serratia marcescens]KFF76350.1 barnase inhibitor [Serratia marcescens]MBH2727482.1 barstar family protein [Serratia marcescens]MBH2818365.1 barstar family protein [Serratia marcescens]MBH2948122.1 barstar family protein [Serratia marcescens]
MMKFKRVVVDFSEINTDDEFHDEMNRVFGFPDFYGNNFNAFVDCLNSLRFPDDGMTSIHLDKDEYLLMKINGMHSLSDDIRYNFLLAVEAVNKGAISFGDEALILLLLVK